MNTYKERIKLCIADPSWRKTLSDLRTTKNKKIVLIGAPAHGNLGDHAIAYEERFFFENFFCEYDYFEILMPLYNLEKDNILKTVNSDDIIAVSGGGWMGNLWIHNENVIRSVIQDYPNNKIIILPQTAYYSDDEIGKIELNKTIDVFSSHKNLRVLARESKSYDLFNQKFTFKGKSSVHIAPDMVLYGKHIDTDEEIEYKKIINVCLRGDCESVQADGINILDEIQKKYNVREMSTIVKSPLPKKKRERALKDNWKKCQEADLMITDRLHAMLFSYINGTPCIALDNKTGKVFGVLSWIENSNMIIKVNSLDEVLMKIEYAISIGHHKFDNNMFDDEFKNIAEIIRKD